jgi:Tfp pilus assembly ATPase PilU
MGMITLDDHLFELARAGAISHQTALDYAQDARDLEARL